MPTRLLALVLVPLLGACMVLQHKEPPAPNTLLDNERANGTSLLFDGVSTAGWRGYKQADCPGGWKVVDGALTRVSEAGDIVSVEEYKDFNLEFEWRIAKGSNSGVMYHVSEDQEAPWETGPEFQILDNQGHKDGLDPRTSAGSNYAMHAPLADVTHPAGEWNSARILVCGPHVEHWLNGKKVVEYELWSDDWKQRVAGCKWKDRPDYGMRTTGRIALQDHGDWVAFRSIKIQRISR
ncbi:MAG: DUF1080 domain-containing protein [Planctomycetes bacterium]|nr:DUF1080 domain-containing protein [Planctomycetota bacterium]